MSPDRRPARSLWRPVRRRARRAHPSPGLLGARGAGPTRRSNRGRRPPLPAAHRPHLAIGDFATSDIAAIAEWADEFQVLDDGDVVDLTSINRRRNHGGDAMPPTMIRSNWRGRDADLNGYADYMAKEIDEQPAAATRVLDELGGGIANGTLWADLGLAPFDRLQVIGCGTSLNAGHVIGSLVRRLGGLPVTRSVASEAAEDVVEPRTLCLAISQSGETADVLHAIESQTTVEPAPVGPHQQLAFHVGPPRRRGHHMCGRPGDRRGSHQTFVCQIIAGAAVMVSALVATNRLSATAAARLVDDLRRLPDQLAAAGTVAKCVVPPIAEELITASGVIYIARGTGLPYAAEGALKLKELTYRWAEHYPAGELKHGPLALIGTELPSWSSTTATPNWPPMSPRFRTRWTHHQHRFGRQHHAGAGQPGRTVGPTRGRHSAADTGPDSRAGSGA